MSTLELISAIKGYPGGGRSLGGRKGTLYISGYIDSPTGGAELLSFLERNADQIEQTIQTFPAVPGHYALAYAANDGSVFLITNQYGSEPIYYGETGNSLLWSFDIKSALPELHNRSIDGRGLDEIARYRWLVEDHTLLAGLYQVLPGHLVSLRQGRAPMAKAYTRLEFKPASVLIKEDAAIDAAHYALDEYFKNLRKTHTRIAVLFSGGVDSSLLIAMARHHGFDRVLAVSAGFPGLPNVEVERAVAIAKHLGVEHKVVDVSESFVSRALPRIVSQLERPSPYENNIARSRIFEFLSSEVSMALTGEGADGMFGGSEAGKIATQYDAQQRFISWMPIKIRSRLAEILSLFESKNARRLHHYLSVNTRDFIREKGTLETANTVYEISAEKLIPRLERIRADAPRPFYSIYEPENPASITAICQNRAFHSQNRNQFYCYSRLASPYGISVSHPFVAPGVAELGLSLPDALKWDSLGTKPILKKLACRYIPSEWIYAKKLGFETPRLEWLRGPLKPFYEMLFEQRTLSRGLFDERAVRSLDIERDRDLIWTAINLELFARQFIDGQAT